jgi:hypothetical protein
MITAALPISMTPILPETPGEAGQTGAMFLATLSARVSTFVMQTMPTADAPPIIGTPALPHLDPAGAAIALAQSLDVAGVALPQSYEDSQAPRLLQAAVEPNLTGAPEVHSSASIVAPNSVIANPSEPPSVTPALKAVSAAPLPQLRSAAKEGVATDRAEKDDGTKKAAAQRPQQVGEHRTFANEAIPVISEDAGDAAHRAAPERQRGQQPAALKTHSAGQSGEREVPTAPAIAVAGPIPLAKQQPQAGQNSAAYDNGREDVKRWNG